MNFHKHFVDRNSFSVEILSEYMEFNQINEFVATMSNSSMGVNLGENKIPVVLQEQEYFPYLLEVLHEVQCKENLAGRSFVDAPEIIYKADRFMLIQDGITNKRVRVITFLAITRVNGESWLASVRGSFPDEAELTKAFILSVLETFKSKDSEGLNTPPFRR